MFSFEEIKTENIFRASTHVIDVWNLIKADFLFTLGIRKSASFYYIIDEETVEETVTSEGDIIKDHVKENTCKKTNIVKGTGLIFNFFITYRNEDNFESFLDYCEYFFNKESKKFKDAGTINLDIEFHGNISSYDKIEEFILVNLAKSTQFAINRIINKKNIDNSYFANIDSLAEEVRMISYLKDIEYNSAIKSLENIDNIQKKYIIKLLEKIDKIK